MKKIYIYLLYFFLFISFIQTTNAQERSKKRGVSYQIPYVEDLEVLSPGVCWFYNWGVNPHPTIFDVYQDYDMDYIPMAWNNSYDRTALREFLTNHPNVKYILGFNEPNFTAQANMTPTAAAAAWPELESIADEFGLKIVGPAMNYAPANGAVSEGGITYTNPFEYLDAFFAACPDCRVDYIAAHCYMNTPEAVNGYVNTYIQKYNKPVWLTEFCAWEYNAPLTSGAIKGYEYQRASMIRKIELLEKNPMVEKYAWFIPRHGSTTSFPYMQLLKNVRVNPDVNPGLLTELGKIYVNMSSFDSAHYFGINEKIPVKDYIESFYVILEESTDSTSNIPIQLCNFQNGIYVDYLVDVPTAGEYPLYLRLTKTSTTVDPRFKIYSNGTQIAEQTLAITDTCVWETRTFNITLPAGKQTIRIGGWDASGCKFQWFSVGEPKEKELSSKVIVFVDEQKYLNIKSDQNIIKSSIYNISGKIIKENNAEKEINLDFLAKGVYIIKIKLENGNQPTLKFIVN